MPPYLNLRLCALQAVQFISPSTVDSIPWLVTGGGRIFMVFLFIICLPSIFMKKLSTVETVANFFVVFIIARQA